MAAGPAWSFDDQPDDVGPDGGTRETLIGTFNLNAPGVSSPPSGVGSAGSDRRRTDAAASASPDDEAEAQQLYHDALEDLEAGNRASAQRLFERLIARQPNSDLAGQSRRHLADLYADRDLRSVAVPAAAREAGRSSQLQPRQGERPLLALPVAQTLPQGVDSAAAAPLPAQPRPKARWVSPDTEMEFITQAGDRVFFGAGSDSLGARAVSVIAAQARWLEQNPGYDVTIEGYADDAPLAGEQQVALSASRAATVRERLIAEGIDARRIAVAARGREDRIATCDEPECAAQNRRAVSRVAEGAGAYLPRSGSPSSAASRLPVASESRSFSTR
ncbi:MAG: OmpA family protein [Hyphomicrobium sp.]